MIRHPKYRPHPPGFLVKPGMTRFLTPDSRIYYPNLLLVQTEDVSAWIKKHRKRTPEFPECLVVVSESYHHYFLPLPLLPANHPQKYKW